MKFNEQDYQLTRGEFNGVNLAQYIVIDSKIIYRILQ